MFGLDGTLDAKHAVLEGQLTWKHNWICNKWKLEIWICYHGGAKRKVSRSANFSHNEVEILVDGITGKGELLVDGITEKEELLIDGIRITGKSENKPDEIGPIMMQRGGKDWGK